VHDPVDDPAIVNPLHTTNIRSANAAQFEPIARPSAKTRSCAWSRSSSKNESGPYCQVGKINGVLTLGIERPPRELHELLSRCGYRFVRKIGEDWFDLAANMADG
jgi:hypothetical protein